MYDTHLFYFLNEQKFQDDLNPRLNQVEKKILAMFKTEVSNITRMKARETILLELMKL